MPNPLLTDVHYEYGTPYATTCYGWCNDCENDARRMYESISHSIRGRINVPQTNNTLRVVTNTPVRDENGRWLFRQCRPKLRTVVPFTQNRLADNRKTVGDVLCLLKQKRDLYRIVLADNTKPRGDK